MSKKPQPKIKLYTVQKFIRARSAAEAIRLERSRKVDDVWVESKWREHNLEQLESAIGFDLGLTKEDDE